MLSRSRLLKSIVFNDIYGRNILPYKVRSLSHYCKLDKLRRWKRSKRILISDHGSNWFMENDFRSRRPRRGFTERVKMPVKGDIVTRAYGRI